MVVMILKWAVIMVVKVNHQEKARFNAIIQEMIAESANIGAHITIDASARAHYVKQIQFMSTQLRSQARGTSGRG